MMHQSRRRFLQYMALLAMAGTMPRLSSAAPRLAFAPAAFDARHDSVLIWVGHDRAARVQLQYRLASATVFQAASVLELVEKNGFCGHVELTGLLPGQRYAYRFVLPRTQQAVTESGYFRTAPLSPGSFSFVFSADISEDYQPYTLFTQMTQTQPDFLLVLGDTAYTDYPSAQFRPSLAYYRHKHALIRRDPHLQAFLLQHVTYAVWDDHEVENNFHSQHPHLTEGLQAFRDYWPGRSATPDALYRQYSWAGVDFFLLDTRRFRSPQSVEDGPAKTMLGKVQKDWFKSVLRASTAPFKFVISSVPFHGNSSDTWGNYATERDELEWYIHQEKIGGVIFLTGDYHLARVFNTDVIAIPEFMAGPIASFSLFERVPARREIFQSLGGFVYGDGPNFGHWQIDPATGVATLAYHDLTGQVLFTTQLVAN